VFPEIPKLSMVRLGDTIKEKKMSTIIGSVTLDRDLVFEDEYDYSLLNATVEDTLGGGLVLQEFEKLERGRNVTLVSTETQGLQTKAKVDELKALADAGANNTYTLTISSNSQSFTKTVRFRTELGIPIEAAPFHPRDGLHSNDILYRIKLYLMVI